MAIIPRDPKSEGSGLMLDDYEFPKEETLKRGNLGDVMTTGMDEGSFFDGVLIFTRGLSEEVLLDPLKAQGAKSRVYTYAGRAYFLDGNGRLVHRLGASQPLIGGAFREDYQRIFPKGREGRRYNQTALIGNH